MKIRAKMTGIMLCCGLIPLASAVAVGYLSVNSVLKSVRDNADQALTQAVESSFQGQRDLKRAQIEDYFKTINDQVLTFADNRMVVESMRHFREAFHTYRAEAGIDVTKLADMRRELEDFYVNKFGAEFASQNSGREIEAKRLLGQLQDDTVALQHAYIAANPNPLGSKHLLDAAETSTRYGELHEVFHPVVRNYLDKFGYYDIFLIDSETGEIVYSVFKEIDYGTSLMDGPYAQTNFGKAFRKANQLGKDGGAVLVDFAQYVPSYDAPASFIATPIFDGDKKIGVAIFQMPVERITTMMSARSGLGESGETILVGSDKRMRSNSFRDPEHHGLVASYRNGETGSVDSPLVTAAIARGESGVKSCEDYLGEKVLAAYAPVKIGGLTWCLIAQITESEAFAATYEMRKTTAQALYGMLRSTLITAALVATLLVVAAWYFGEKIALPISQASEFATKIAEGDLTQPCDAVAYGETGELISSMNAMQSGLSRIVQDLRGKATTMSESSHDLMLMSENLASEASEATMTSTSVSAAAEELATNMKVMATQTDDVSADIKSIAVSIEEMTTTIEEIAKSATLSATESQQAEDLVSASSESVGELGRAAGQIASVVEIIQDIADKTNMLALNATIEAARAGDAGKGFAVVACEVKELASQTSQATNDIRKQVEEIQSSTGAVVDSIKAVVDSIASIGDKTRRISAAVEEQSVTTRNISDVIASTALRASSLSSAVEETALASQEITRGVAQVDRMAHQTADAATKTKATGGRLRELSSDAEELVSVFQVSG